jgi:hypothetical protein
MHTVRSGANAIQLAVYEQGEGPAVVFSHGFHPCLLLAGELTQRLKHLVDEVVATRCGRRGSEVGKLARRTNYLPH